MALKSIHTYSFVWHIQQHFICITSHISVCMYLHIKYGLFRYSLYTLMCMCECMSARFILVFCSFGMFIRSLARSFYLFTRLFHCFWPTKNLKMLLKSQYRIEPFYWKSAFTRILRLTFFFGRVHLFIFIFFSSTFWLIFFFRAKRIFFSHVNSTGSCGFILNWIFNTQQIS